MWSRQADDLALNPGSTLMAINSLRNLLHHFEYQCTMMVDSSLHWTLTQQLEEDALQICDADGSFIARMIMVEPLTPRVLTSCHVVILRINQQNQRTVLRKI